MNLLSRGSLLAAFLSMAALPPALSAADAPLVTKGLLTQALTDPELKGFQAQVVELTVKPGAHDQRPHRHDADLFVYILEGAIETSFEHQAPVKYTAGQVFHEPRNILHTSLRNLSATAPARLLLVYVIKEGRSTYRPEAGHGGH